jgi:hypothetical protein
MIVDIPTIRPYIVRPSDVSASDGLWMNQAVLGLTEKEDVAVSFSHGLKLRSRRLVP